MRTQWIIGAALAAALAACGPSNDGRVAMEVAVSGLTETQNFCFTWQLYQYDDKLQEWAVIDQMADPTCGERGDDTESALGTCYDGRRFLITYDVTFYDNGNAVGTAKGTSGGGERDLCVKNFDTPSNALFQFGNEGNVGGVNPGVEIDQVCVNDKLQIEDGRIVSALWLQGDTCGEGPPDQYCVLGSGYGLRTTRYGILADEITRYLFSASDFAAGWDMLYVAFDAVVPTNKLVLQHNPYVLIHQGYGEFTRRWMAFSPLAYRYDEEGGHHVGFVWWEPARYEGFWIFSDVAAACNEGVKFGAAWEYHVPSCATPLVFLGGIPTGGTRFELAFLCGEDLMTVPCDAGAASGSVCSAATLRATTEASPL